MNPISTHQIGQATHREYEAKYGHQISGEAHTNNSTVPVNRRKQLLAVGGLSLTGVIVVLLLLL